MKSVLALIKLCRRSLYRCNVFAPSQCKRDWRVSTLTSSNQSLLRHNYARCVCCCIYVLWSFSGKVPITERTYSEFMKYLYILNAVRCPYVRR